MNTDHVSETPKPVSYALRWGLAPLVYLVMQGFFIWRSDIPHRGRTFATISGTVVLVVICIALADRVLTRRGVTTEGKKKLIAIVLGAMALLLILIAVARLIFA